MARARRLSIVGGVIAGLLSTQMNAMVFASEATDTPAIASSVKPLNFDAALVTTKPMFKPLSPEFTAAAGQVYRGRPYRLHHEGSVAAIILGSAAAIAGTAVLVYANRPECSANQYAGGCGYGTKVIGTSVLAGGVVSLFVGALTW